jgi:hypothetical protein
MTHIDFDDGLVHGHAWASSEGMDREALPMVADAAEVNTPSSLLHDVIMNAE